MAARDDSEPAPIALFAYNRPAHTLRTVEALRDNDLAAESDLFVFCDGARNIDSAADVEEVRTYARSIVGFRSLTVVERESNLGLARSIIDGVTRVCNEFGKIIVVEDDLVTARGFLRYMNDALRLYREDAQVGSVHGYWYRVDAKVPATFFLRGASCWGWATWARAWRFFEPDGAKLLAELHARGLTDAFDLGGARGYMQMLRQQIAGRNDSWAIRWHASMFLGDFLQLSPGTSLVRNIGFDGSGAHRVATDAYSVEIASRSIEVGRIPIRECEQARAALIDYYRKTKRSLPARAWGRLRRTVGW